MPAYIIVVSPDVGGAERRFFDIFTALRRAGEDIYYVAPSLLVEKLAAAVPGREDVVLGIVSVPMSRWRPMEFIRRFRKLLAGIPRGSTFHYPLNSLWPLHIGRGDRLVQSVVNCFIVPRLFTRHVHALRNRIAFQFSERIDVLGPTIYGALRGNRYFSRMSLTPGGTFLVPSAQVSAPASPALVFMGRLYADKGIEDYLDILPHLWPLLEGKVPDGFTFTVCGYGTLAEWVNDRAGELARQGIPIRYLGYRTPEEIFSPATIFISLQRVTNFPSRVVAEALIAGGQVIVRKSGDSEMFGHDLLGLHYCDDVLDPKEIAVLVLDILDGGTNRSQHIIETAMRRFNSAAYLDYYRDLYGFAR